MNLQQQATNGVTLTGVGSPVGSLVGLFVGLFVGRGVDCVKATDNETKVAMRVIADAHGLRSQNDCFGDAAADS